MISTYGGQGAAKKDARSQDHAVVYSSAEYEPRPGPDENLTLGAFPIIIEEAGERLDPRSRIDLGKVYTVEHNVRVLRVGRISPDHIKRLNEAFARTMGFAATPEDLDLDGLESQEDEETLPAGLQTYRTHISETDYHDSTAYPQIGQEDTTPLSAATSQSTRYIKSTDADSSQPYELSSTRYVKGTVGESEKIDSSYSVRWKDHKKFFKVGRVFTTLWTDAVGGNANATNSSFVSVVMYGEKVYSKVRRFVVVREGDRSCTCLPVTTYDGAGPQKSGISLGDHGFIYSHRVPKRVEGMRSRALKLNLSRSVAPMREPSLVNYAKVYTVETNVKVKDIGILDAHSKDILRHYFRKVFSEIESDPPSGDMTPRASPAPLASIGSGPSDFYFTGLSGDTATGYSSRSVYSPYSPPVAPVAYDTTPAKDGNEYPSAASSLAASYGPSGYGNRRTSYNTSPSTTGYGTSAAVEYSSAISYSSEPQRDEPRSVPAYGTGGYSSYDLACSSEPRPDVYPPTRPPMDESDSSNTTTSQDRGYAPAASVASTTGTAEYGRYRGQYSSGEDILLPSLADAEATYRRRESQSKSTASAYSSRRRGYRDDRRRR
jgi:hypothetical protein